MYTVLASSNSEWLDELIRLMEDYPAVLAASAIVLILLGVLNCLFGYKLFNVVLGIFAYITGAAASGFAAHFIFKIGPASTILIASTGGILNTIVFIQLSQVGIFLFAAALGGALAAVASGLVAEKVEPLAVVITGLAFGLITFKKNINKLLIVFATSFFGGLYIVLGVAQLLRPGIDTKSLEEGAAAFSGWQKPDVETIILLSCWVLLIAAGIILQYKVTAKKQQKAKRMPPRTIPKDVIPRDEDIEE